MKEFVEFIVKHPVDKPDEVRITEVEGEKITVLELHVGEEDYGKVIGKRGKNIMAIRTLLNAAARTVRKRVSLEILE